jgi:hypothetical protein
MRRAFCGEVVNVDAANSAARESVAQAKTGAPQAGAAARESVDQAKTGAPQAGAAARESVAQAKTGAPQAGAAARESVDQAKSGGERAGAAARQSVGRASEGGKRIAERERWWLVPFGRSGFAANGLVYLVVGVLAIEAALGRGGDTTDPGGALARLLGAPLGRVVVALLAVGLAGYAVWRLVQALLDSEHKGSEPRGLVQRVGFGISAASYASLAASAVGMALQRVGQPNGDQATQDRTAWLLSQPFGRWLVIAAGLIVLGVAVAQVVQAYRASFEDNIREHELGPRLRTFVRAAGRAGYLARGLAFALIAAFLVAAGWRSSPDQARGLGGVLTTLAAQPLGPWLLGGVAIGLIGYGLHMLVSARYRDMVLT